MTILTNITKNLKMKEFNRALDVKQFLEYIIKLKPILLYKSKNLHFIIDIYYDNMKFIRRTLF